MKQGFDDTDTPRPPHAERTADLAVSPNENDRSPHEEGQGVPARTGARPTPDDRGPGPAILAMAAEHADIVDAGGLTQRRHRTPGMSSVADSARTLSRVRQVRDRSGGRAYECGVLPQIGVVGVDMGRTAAEVPRKADPGVSPEKEPLREDRTCSRAPRRRRRARSWTVVNGTASATWWHRSSPGRADRGGPAGPCGRGGGGTRRRRAGTATIRPAGRPRTLPPLPAPGRSADRWPTPAGTAAMRRGRAGRRPRPDGAPP